jgi:hypothetical protein
VAEEVKAGEGTSGVATVKDGRVLSVTLRTDQARKPSVTVTLSAGEKGLRGDFIGPMPSGVGISMVIAPTSNPFAVDPDTREFRSGTMHDSDERFPPPAEIEFQAISGGELMGAIRGVFWERLMRGGNEPDQRASVQVEFTARVCEVGTPDFGACTRGR